MTQYKNLGGDSGVVSYMIDSGSIEVTFKDGSTYLYTDQRPGPDAVEQMKALALAGHGLNAFISIHVKKNYAAKLR